MSNPFVTRSGVLTRLLALTAMAAFLAGVGCSDDDDDGNGGTPTPTTTFAGGFVGSGDGGRMSVTVSTATLAPGLHAAKADFAAGESRLLRAGSLTTLSVGASGSIDLSGGPVVALAGTYNDVTDSLNLSGGGYTFLGAYDSTGSVDAITGGYAGPNGTGFFGCLLGTSGTVQTFCGTFANAGLTIQGRWNLIIMGDEIAAGAVVYGSAEVMGMEGTVTGTGNPRTITLIGDSGGTTMNATGSWNTTTNVVTGTWTTSDGISTLDSGTWGATPCE